MSPGPEGRILIPKTSLRGFYETAKAGPFFATCCGTAEAVPFQSCSCRQMRIQMRLLWQTSTPGCLSPSRASLCIIGKIAYSAEPRQTRWSILYQEGFHLSHIRYFAVLLAVSLTIGCRAQSATQAPLDPATNRRIEVAIRSTYSLPPNYDVVLGARKPSAFTGYDEMSVTISNGGKSQIVSFLLSTDGKTLARMETFDLLHSPASSIDIAGRPMRGNPNAKVTVINFDDLECPYCSRMHQTLFPSTLARYKDKVRFVYKDFPLTELHPWALHASEDANCLAAQNSDVYWSYVDYLHTHADEVTGTERDLGRSYATLDRIARQEGATGKLDNTKLDTCIAKHDETEIDASLKEASSLGLDGAPALFINGEKINGAFPEDQVWMAIDRALRAAGEEPPPPPAAPKPAPTAAKPSGGN